MKEKMLPQWLVNMIIVLYRFMCSGFGKKVPKPYYGNFCGPFWAVFFTYLVPILTPFVIAAVVVRILFGKGRGEAVGSVVVSSGSWAVATKTRSAVNGLILLVLIIIPIVLFWENAWRVLAAMGAFLGIGALFFALLWLTNTGRLDFFASFCGKVENFWDGLPKPARWGLIGIGVVITSPAILALALIVGLIYGIGFVYENYCPLVRESSPQP